MPESQGNKKDKSVINAEDAPKFYLRAAGVNKFPVPGNVSLAQIVYYFSVHTADDTQLVHEADGQNLPLVIQTVPITIDAGTKSKIIIPSKQLVTH